MPHRRLAPVPGAPPRAGGPSPYPGLVGIPPAPDGGPPPCPCCGRAMLPTGGACVICRWCGVARVVSPAALLAPAAPGRGAP